MSLRPVTRVPWSLDPSPLARALDAARAQGRPLLDLTGSDPGSAGLRPDPAAIAAALLPGLEAGYRPDPCGAPAARAAVARYYADHGRSVDPESVLLTASTSEAYAWLFKLCCEPGEAIAVPSPSYPLFDFLTTLEAVRALPYPLRPEDGWRVDVAAVERRLEEGARGVLVVQPSNPVAGLLDEQSLSELCERCAAHDATLVVDEVFLDAAPTARSVAGEARCRTVVLSGLSKVCALPELKCAWMVVSGPGSEEARARLELVADTFLSVNGPVQAALPALLTLRHELQSRLGARLAHNRQTLARQRGPRAPWDIVGRPEGWYAVLRVPGVRSSDAWALHLLDTADLVVHPGHFYELEETHLVASLLTPVDTFREGVARLAAGLASAGYDPGP